MIEQTGDDRDELFIFSKDDPAVPEIREFWNFRSCLLCGRDVREQRILCDACRKSLSAVQPEAFQRELARNLWLQVRMLGLFTTTDLPTILFDLIKLIRDLYGFDRTGAYLIEAESRRIRGIGFLGLQDAYIENFDISIESDDPNDQSAYGVIRKVAQTGECVIVNDRSADPSYSERLKSDISPDQKPAKCFAVFPLPRKQKGKVVGMVSVSNMETHPNPQITPEQVARLDLILSYATLSIEKSLDNLRRARAEEEQQ